MACMHAHHGRLHYWRKSMLKLILADLVKLVRQYLDHRPLWLGKCPTESTEVCHTVINFIRVLDSRDSLSNSCSFNQPQIYCFVCLFFYKVKGTHEPAVTITFFREHLQIIFLMWCLHSKPILRTDSTEDELVYSQLFLSFQGVHKLTKRCGVNSSCFSTNTGQRLVLKNTVNLH